MLLDKQIYEQSLVNHIYFAGSIRSFCTTIGLTFFRNNQDYIDRAIALGYQATDIINLAISYMNKEIANAVLDNKVYITDYTKDLDLLTQKLFDISLKIKVDEDLNKLKSKGNVIINEEIMKKINDLNDKALILINDFKEFCLEIKNKLLNQTLFSYLYIDFYTYMHDEIAVYGRDIERIKSKNDYTDFYLNEYTFYFNELLSESAKYIRGFVDTSHQDIFDKASFYVNAFANLTEKYLKNNKDNSNLRLETERLVKEYKNFASNIIDKLLKSELYFITPPITLDNFLTNINVYNFILQYVRTINN